MDNFYIRDSVDIEIPFSISDSVSRANLDIKDHVLTDAELEGKALEVVIDATHCGYFNRNYYNYDKNGMAAAVSSWLEPYAKPILIEHDSNRKGIGRATMAMFMPIGPSKFKKDTEEKKLKGRPTGRIRITALVTDQEAIKDILTSRFLTVSTGGRPLAAPTCSICKTEAHMSFFGPMLGCDHELGSIDEDKKGRKKFIGMMVPQMDYSECSFVNHPADYSSDHVAKTVSMSLVSFDPSQEDGVHYDQIVAREGVIFDRVKSEKEEDEMKLDKALLEKAKELGIEVTDEMTNETLQVAISEKESQAAQENSGADSETEQNDPPADDSATDGDDETDPDDDTENSDSDDQGTEGTQEGDENTEDSDSENSEDSDSENGEEPPTDEEIVLSELQKKHDALEKEKEGQDAKIAALEQTIKEKDSLIQASDKRIVDLTSQIKDKLAEKVIDLSLAMKASLVVDVLNSEDGKEFQEKYSEIKKDLMKRSYDSLTDKVSDLVSELALNRIDGKVDQPGVDDTEEVNDPFRKIIEEKNEDNKNGSSVSAKIFGIKKDKEEK